VPHDPPDCADQGWTPEANALRGQSLSLRIPNILVCTTTIAVVMCLILLPVSDY
jgi:hypothetical protein